MAITKEACMILYSDVTRADFEKAAVVLGFAHFETRPVNADQRAYEQVWATPSIAAPTAAVHYVEDPISNLRYLVVRGADVPNLVGKIADRLPVFTPAELLNDALEATEHDEQVRAINRLAIGIGDWDPAVSTIISTFATQAQNPILREAAVNAMGFRAWPEYRPILERIAAEDPAENVRQHAARLLAHWPARSGELPEPKP